jgi:hypothetical protein
MPASCAAFDEASTSRRLVRPAGFADRPDHVSKPHCLFSSRIAAGKIAELERPRRHPKAFGTPSNFSLRDPFERPARSPRRMSGERSAFHV